MCRIIFEQIHEQILSDALLQIPTLLCQLNNLKKYDSASKLLNTQCTASIESADDEKRIWLYPLGSCEFEAAASSSAGHWPQGSDTPETSSFLTIKQNKKHQYTHNKREEGDESNSELRLFNCAVDCGTLDPGKQRNTISAICWELDTGRKCDCVIFSSFNKSYFTHRLQNSAKCLNHKQGLRSCSVQNSKMSLQNEIDY